MANIINRFCNNFLIFNNSNVKILNIISINKIYPNVKFSSEVTVSSTPKVSKTEKTSKAMKAYLERAEEHEKFMKSQRLEYEIGKRHLANMLGEDVETLTQSQIDETIEYLFPSGLYDKRARPIFKPPEEIFPQRKAAEFDASGRPYHCMFYTGQPHFYKLLYDIVENINKMNALEDRMIRKNSKPDPNLKIDLSGSRWFSKEELDDYLVEEITDLEYDNFINAMTRLSELPYSYQCADYIKSYRKPLMSQTNKYEIIKPQQSEDGRSYVTVYECLRKSARGDVTLRYPGTGLITINGKDITYFENTQPREQIIFPLIFSNMIGKIDIEANIEGGGPSGQAGAIRWGISMGLRSFVDPEVVEEMRLAGLLQRDYRRRERKKPGQEGARRKFTWKKR